MKGLLISGTNLCKKAAANGYAASIVKYHNLFHVPIGKAWSLSIMLLLLMISCKKEGEPVPNTEKFDLTNYFITGELPTAISEGRTYNSCWWDKC